MARGRLRAPSARDVFRAGVFARDGRRCVICGAPATDAHHLLNRDLFADGGYDVDNGVSLCAAHHLEAEATTLSVERLRAAAGISRIVVPGHLDPGETYDTWGNVVVDEGLRLAGELYAEPQVQSHLRAAGVQVLPYRKYPRTPHLPWSPGASADDRVLADTAHLDGRNVVVTAKLDGENTTMYRDHLHARSISSGPHPSRTWVAALHARIAHEIPEGWRLCGENLYARHSIAYTELPSYFVLLSIFNERNECLSVAQLREWAALLELQTAPVLYEGPFSRAAVAECHPRPVFGGDPEGYVVRLSEGFAYRDFGRSVAKFVRDDFVPGQAVHWQSRPVEPNGLAPARR